MSSLLQRWLPLASLLALALALRTWDLDRRPMHADEANQAVKTGELLEGRGYAFDPADHHGPTLYYAALPLAWLRGEHTLAQLTETTVRLVPALAGTLAVLLLYALACSSARVPVAENAGFPPAPAPGSHPLAESLTPSPTSRWPAFAAAAFLAVSPPAVYFSRYFVQETLLLACFLGAIACAFRWWTGGRLRWSVACGACVGLMQATKASTPLFLLAALAGLAVARPPRAASSRIPRDLVAAALAATFAAGLFYSSFGANLRGLADALTTYASSGRRLAGPTGHEKPWWYYLSLYAWHRDGGVLTQQVLFSLVACAGIARALSRGAPRLLRGALAYLVVLVVVLSAVPYKTPWHAIHLAPPLALLAAAALGDFAGRRRGRLVPVGLALLILLLQGDQVALTSFQRPADERNPLAYVHTSPDVLKLRPLALAALADFPDRPVRIVSEEIWPLPWYLRGLPRVGYWTGVPEECDGALVVASAGLAEQVQSRLHGPYQSSFVGLRPGFTLVVYRRQP